MILFLAPFLNIFVSGRFHGNSIFAVFLLVLIFKMVRVFLYVCRCLVLPLGWGITCKYFAKFEFFSLVLFCSSLSICLGIFIGSAF